MSYLKSFFALLFFASLISCGDLNDPKVAQVEKASVEQTATPSTSAAAPFAGPTKKLDPYWFQGKGEVNTYELSQNRYADVHPGTAVLIFVTEDFLTDKQVKNESYQSDQSAKVLKTNFIRRFTTGLYDYSLMSSVFTPINTEQFPHTLKVTTSVQDWCGQVYAQVNWTEEGYRQQLRSYFEREGDQEASAPTVMLEDEVFNRIRLDFTALPTGKMSVIPSLSYLRLRHRPFNAYEAGAELKDYEGEDFKGDQLKSYLLSFPSENRQLEIVFQAEAPHQIEGWVDSYPSMDGEVRRTVATLKHSVLEDYWTHHSPEDESMRRQLGL